VDNVLSQFTEARTEYDLRPAFSEHDRSRLAYSTARSGYDDDLAFDSIHEVFLFHLSDSKRLIATGRVCRVCAPR